MSELYSVVETAKRLKIATITLRRLIKKRSVPFHRIGHKYFFTDDDINNFLLKAFYPIIEEIK
jgi:excisionase family DNA binding protein